MKDFIVLCGMVGLGIAIYQMIMGPDDGTVIHIMGEAWKQEIAVRTSIP